MKDLLSVLLVSIIAVTMASPVCKRGYLQAYVYHLPAEPVVYQGTNNLSFSPTSFTLIVGKYDAVLVDAPATIAQGEELSSWITSTIPDKTLKAIYITHGHGDHFFASNIIQKNHPSAKVLATAGTAEHMVEQYEEAFWDAVFPGKLSHARIVPEILPADDRFYLEGHVLQAVEVGQGDAWKSTVLHVPDLELVVGGDVVYGNCHQLFAETNTVELRKQWLASLDKVAALKPKVVVPSHQTAGNGYAASHVQDTQAYIRYYDVALAKAKSWQELEGLLKTEFPEKDGTFILRWTSQAPFNAAF